MQIAGRQPRLTPYRALAILGRMSSVNQRAVVESILYGPELAKNSQALTLSASAAVSALLTPGRYKLCATQPCWVNQGNSGVTVAEAGDPSEFIPSGFVRYFSVADADNGYVAVIESGGNGGYVSITSDDRTP